MSATTTERAFTPEEARQLALAVGPDWSGELVGTEEGRAGHVELRRGEACIDLHVGGYRLDGRVSVRGDFPRSKDGHLFTGRGGGHVITLARSRSVAEIGREIRRRLLPGYLAALEDAVAARDRHLASCRGAAELAERLVALSGGRLRPGPDWQQRHGSEVALSGRLGDGTHLDLRVYDHGVRIDSASLSHALAEGVAALLARAS